MALSFVDEMEEDVVDAPTNGGAEVQELAIYTMKSCLEEIAFTRILRIEKFEKVEYESLVDVTLGMIGVEVRVLHEAQKEFVDDLQVRPGKFEDRLVFFGVVSVARRIDRRGYRTEKIGRKLRSSHIHFSRRILSNACEVYTPSSQPLGIDSK